VRKYRWQILFAKETKFKYDRMGNCTKPIAAINSPQSPSTGTLLLGSRDTYTSKRYLSKFDLGPRFGGAVIDAL